MKKLLKVVVFAAAAAAAGTALAGVTFFEGERFSGQPLALDGYVPDFRAYDFNDRAMSLIVDGAPVEVCADIQFGGNCQVFAPGRYPHLGVWSGTISSVRPAYSGRYGRYDGGYYPRGYYDRSYDSARWHYDPRYDHRGY